MVDRSLLNSASFFSCSSLATYSTKIHFTKKTELFLPEYLSLHYRNGQLNFTIIHFFLIHYLIITLTTTCTRILHDLLLTQGRADITAYTYQSDRTCSQNQGVTGEEIKESR